jgi:hypothetical protein
MTPPTTVTRRSLLRIGGATAAATFLGMRPWAPAEADAAAGYLLRSSYAGLVGKRFSAGSVELRLVSVTDVAGAPNNSSLAGSEDAFVLTFSGPLAPALHTGTHTLAIRELGRFELFVSPVEKPRDVRRYEAVIDRSVSPTRKK